MRTKKQPASSKYCELERTAVVNSLARQLRPRLASGEFELAHLVQIVGYLLERGTFSCTGRRNPMVKEEVERIKELLMQELQH